MKNGIVGYYTTTNKKRELEIIIDEVNKELKKHDPPFLDRLIKTKIFKAKILAKELKAKLILRLEVVK